MCFLLWDLNKKALRRFYIISRYEEVSVIRRNFYNVIPPVDLLAPFVEHYPILIQYVCLANNCTTLCELVPGTVVCEISLI
jgi:hypothetical protein